MNLSYRLNSFERHATKIIAPPMTSSKPIASPMKPDGIVRYVLDHLISDTYRNAQRDRGEMKVRDVIMSVLLIT
jgi:hypothetical protein